VVQVFKNKFFVIALTVAIILTVAAMGLNIAGHGNIVSDAVNIIIYPFQVFANVLKDSFFGFTSYFTEFNNYKKENAELKEYIALLESKLDGAIDFKERYEDLLAYHNIKQVNIEYDRQPATVIARGAGNFISTLTINQGSLHEIEKNMPVISPDGIVGYIGEVGLGTSKVILFTRTSVSISAYIDRTGITGIVEGDFELEKEGLCKLTMLPKDADLRVGDRIISSGYGGIFPEGLTIGVIVDIKPDDLSQTLIGYVKPAADLSKIRNVMVIHSFETKFY